MKTKNTKIKNILKQETIAHHLNFSQPQKTNCSFFKFNKKAFTLAEVLVTLTIIGVVAAITVPTVSHNATKHATINTLKTTYSILSQAIHRAQADYGDASEWITENGQWTEKGANEVAEKLKPYLKIAKDCGTYDEKRECVKFDHTILRNGTISTILLPTDKRYYKFMLNNGAIIWIKTASGNEYTKGSYFVIFVDTNGHQKPNKTGDDLFAFSFENNKLIPWGAPTSHYPYETECLPKSSTGYGCAYYVLTTGKMDY